MELVITRCRESDETRFLFFFFSFHHTAIDILVSRVFINYFVSIIFNCAGFNVSDFIDWNIKNPRDWKKRDCFSRRGNVTLGEEGEKGGKSEVIRAIEAGERGEGGGYVGSFQFAAKVPRESLIVRS